MTQNANPALATEVVIWLADTHPSPAATVSGDRDRLVQSLLNLVANAIKYSPSGGTVSIGLHQDARDGAVRFCVQDQGPGITPEQAARLFQPFEQLDRSRGGTGLGLAITRKLIELHGGRVGVQAAAGGGSLFYLELPAAAGAQTGLDEDRGPPDRPGAAAVSSHSSAP